MLDTPEADEKQGPAPKPGPLDEIPVMVVPSRERRQFEMPLESGLGGNQLEQSHPTGTKRPRNRLPRAADAAVPESTSQTHSLTPRTGRV